MAKMEFCSNQVQKGLGMVLGQEWYDMEAFKTLHQALGRLIRHAKDWGVVVFMEKRFSGTGRNLERATSKWMSNGRRSLQVKQRFDKGMEMISKFIKYHRKVSMNIPAYFPAFIPKLDDGLAYSKYFKELATRVMVARFQNEIQGSDQDIVTGLDTFFRILFQEATDHDLSRHLFECAKQIYFSKGIRAQNKYDQLYSRLQ
jgi:hypothetical protein